MTARPWNDADRDAFRRGERLRAQTIPSRRPDGPSAAEWDDDASQDDPTHGGTVDHRG